MEVRRDPRSFFFFIVLLLLLNSSDPGGQQPFTPRNAYSELLQREWDQLDLLNRTRYGDFDARKNRWLNITGLRDEDGFDWYLLDRVKQQAQEQTRRLLGSSAEAALDGDIDDGKALPVYRNISGYVEGEWVRSPLGHVRHPEDVNASTVILPDGTSFIANEFERNLTGTGGMVRLHLTELEGRMRTDGNRTVSEVSARVIIGDNGSTGGNWWEFVLNGVHFPKFGGSVLTTTSERYAGIFALPHFQLSQHLYSSSQQLLNSTIHDTIQRQINRVYPVWNPWTSAVDGANDAVIGSPHCEFVLFLQQHPRFPTNLEHPDTGSPFDIDWLEHEMRYPTGASLPHLSPMSMSMVGFSPDCGFVIESKGSTDQSLAKHSHLDGSKTEEFNIRAKHSVTAFTITLCLQLMFLVKQMKETATPSTRNRVSFYTIAMLATGDGFGFLSLIFMHLFLGTAQLALYATAFMSLFSVIFELRFLMDIWTVQATEQMRLDRQQAPTTTPSESQTTPTVTPTNMPALPVTSSGGGLPLPATAPRPGASAPIIIAPDQDDPADNAAAPTPARDATTNTGAVPARAELGALYSRYCLLLIAIFFLTLQFTAVRSTARAIYFNTICFAYLSFWCPQIYRNIMRNCRKALRWDFVLGQSFVRLVPITYLYAISDNVLFAKTDIRALLVLVGWVWVQLLGLASQEFLGSRFFIREGWAPPAYDYHPILREDEEGATMPIGLSSSGSGATPSSPSTSSKPGEAKASKGKKVFDCSICAQDVEVPVIPSDTSSENTAGLSSGLVLQRRAYMVTPCRHIFHTPCLEGWMRYRLQCPNCREILPPL